MIDRLIDWSLRRPMLTLLVVALVSLWGVVVFRTIPKDIYPDLNAPIVTIITENPGMAAEDVERLITRPLESLLAGAPQVTKVRSESAAGDSVVTVEFSWGTDIYLARQIVTSKLELVSGRLPKGTTPPLLGPVSSRMGEVFEFVVVGDENTDPMTLRSVADWTVRYRLQGVPGISFLVNMGGFIKQYQVLLKPDMLRHFGVTVGDVREAIENSNRNFSGGVLTRGAQELLIRGSGRIETIDHIKNTVVTARRNVPVFVRDVAEVRVGEKFRRESTGHDGNPAVCVTVEKQYGGDTLSAIANVKAALGRIAQDLPKGISLKPFYDQSKLILGSISHVEVSILEGIVLIGLIMMLFLWNLRGAFIASLTVPFSILISLVLMDLFGIKLTVMSIGGLAIGIGKMANGSILMVENILRVLAEHPDAENRQDLVAQAAKEVGRYLFSASAIIILVFLPLLTLQGLEGALFRPTAFAVAAALFAAMLLNVTVQPILAHFLLARRRVTIRQNPLELWIEGRYHRWLDVALAHRRGILAVFVLLLVAAGVSYRLLGKEFVPPLDEGAVLVSTVMLPETSLDESERMGRRIEAMLRAFPEVVSVTRTTGSAEGSEHLHPVNHSHFNLELLPREQRERDYQEITAAMRVELDKLPGILYIFEQPIANKLSEMLTGTEGELSVKIFGPDMEVLGTLTEEVREVLADIDGVADLQVEQTTGIPQLHVRLDRDRLARHGISVAHAAEIVETALNGEEITDVFEGEQVTPVFLRLPDAYRDNEQAVLGLLVDTPAGERVPLSEVASISYDQGPQTIFREDMQRRKVILCNIEGRDIGGFVAEARKRIASAMTLPAGYEVVFGGQYESQQRALRHLLLVMIMVLLIIFVILYASLGRVWQASLIILNIPTTLIGGILGLLIAGQTINVSSLIGLIALFGICVQNDIILVAKINDLRQRGLGLRDAVVRAALTKLRPILMTDLVMIFSVLPLALVVSTGAELHRPLAVVYIGGFIFAIGLRLFIVPLFYEWFGTIAERRAAAGPA